MTRREERIEAFKIIFQGLFYNENTSIDNEIGVFTKELIECVNNNREQLVSDINNCNMENKRFFLIDFAIILLAYAEAKFQITPKEVAVNEAVEIAKVYSTDESPAFVNAFLKALIK